MCFDCDEYDPPCNYCGNIDCYGHCDDPDVCPSCWIYENIPYDYTSSYHDNDDEECMENSCTCKCHCEDYEDMGIRFEAGVQYYEDDGPPFERKGVFPFMELPGEIREKIYGYTFLQEGLQRQHPSTKHRGFIHTNLLRTCRQVYREASDLPMTINKLSFNSALHALDFVGCLLIPRLRCLVTTIHIEYHFNERGDPAFQPLMRELSKLPITHLSLTIKGGTVKESFDHTCWIKMYKVLKQLKTFDLTIASGLMTEKHKKQVQEMCRTELIDGYVRSEKGKGEGTKSKRPAPDNDSSPLQMPIKKAKKVFPTQHQAKIIRSPKSQRLGFESTRFEREAAEIAAKAAAEQARLALLSQYALIKDYAISIEPDAALVKIRLEDALNAAEAVDERNFQLLVQDILVTLDQTFKMITAARKRIPMLSEPDAFSTLESTQGSYASSDAGMASDFSLEL